MQVGAGARVRRILAAMAAGVAATVMAMSLSGASPASASGVDADSARADLVGRINALRASQGLPQLTESPALTMVAQDWAQRMAAAGAISHRPDLAAVAPPEWIRLGENVGVGPSIASLDAAFIASPHHYENLVDPAFRYVGVGVVDAGNGMLYVTENFMTVAPSAAAPAPAPVVVAASAAAPAPACRTKACKAAARRKPAARRPAHR